MSETAQSGENDIQGRKAAAFEPVSAPVVLIRAKPLIFQSCRQEDRGTVEFPAA